MLFKDALVYYIIIGKVVLQYFVYNVYETQLQGGDGTMSGVGVGLASVGGVGVGVGVGVGGVSVGGVGVGGSVCATSGE